MVSQAKEIDKPQDLQQEETSHSGYYGTAEEQHAVANADPEENAAWPLGRPDMPQIKSLNVKCEKNHMKVFIEFDRPFHGMIFSKGHFSDPKCVHLPPNTGHIAVNFDIFLGSCGMTSSQSAGEHGEAGGLYIEDTVIIQYDPQVQEIWDQARRLRCTWYDFYEKAVTFRPFNVDMLDAVTANFLGDNIQCWMQIQVGKGPWASEVAGIVKIGQTMTMVLAIKDDENKFDMLVRNCVAHDGKHQPIALVDEQGCVARPKIMSRFQKIKNFGSSASVVSYAYFQAFKFPDSMNVHFQCVIQVCRYECPEPKCPNDHLQTPAQFDDGVARDHHGAYSENKPVYVQPSEEDDETSIDKRQGDLSSAEITTTVGTVPGKPRALRQRREITEDIETTKVIQVVAPGDVAFSLGNELANQTATVYSSPLNGDRLCMPLAGFTVALVALLVLLIVSSLVAGFLFMRVRHVASGWPKPDFVKVVH